MPKVSCDSGSDSRDSAQSQSSSAGDDDQRFAHIKAANRKVRLIDILRHYGIKIEKNYQRPSWSANITCPLPNHKGSKERTPSFGYCFISDHFFCLGCGQTGRAVEFISSFEGIPRSVVANRILEQYGENISKEDFYEDYKDNILPILIDTSKYIQGLVKEYKSNKPAMDQINKMIWWLDMFLMTKAPGNHIQPEDLTKRVHRLKELLDATIKSPDSR